jgi:cytochrome c oxidase subunit 2
MTDGGGSPVRDARAPIAQMIGIGAIASVLGVALALLIDWFPVSASTQAKSIDTLWDVLMIASVPVFVLVVTVVLYSVIRFRMRPGEELADGPPIHGNTKLEIVWTAIPSIIVAVLCAYAYVVLVDIEKAQANSMEVRVVGEQFTWTFYYPGEGGKEVASNQLYLPKDRPVNFTVQSKDVLHDFWVPAFRMKIDAVRGVDTHLRVTPSRIGQYPVVCAELCGLGHSAMRQTAHVVAPAEFETWLSDQAAKTGGGGESAAAGDEAPDGKAIFVGDASCKNCHTLADAGANATIGPNLDKVLAGMSKAEIREAIVDPNAQIADGYPPDVMPGNFADTLGDSGVDAVVQYLMEVTKR